VKRQRESAGLSRRRPQLLSVRSSRPWPPHRTTAFLTPTSPSSRSSWRPSVRRSRAGVGHSLFAHCDHPERRYRSGGGPCSACARRSFRSRGRPTRIWREAGSRCIARRGPLSRSCAPRRTGRIHV